MIKRFSPEPLEDSVLIINQIHKTRQIKVSGDGIQN